MRVTKCDRCGVERDVNMVRIRMANAGDFMDPEHYVDKVLDLCCTCLPSVKIELDTFVRAMNCPTVPTS